MIERSRHYVWPPCAAGIHSAGAGVPLATSASHGHDADCHFLASGIAAIANFPLWRASAIAQSGFKLQGRNVVERYYNAVMPHTVPYRGVLATMLGMTWARGAIFYFSDAGKSIMKERSYNAFWCQTVPPLVIGTIVQFINMPLVRATITIQNPASELKTVSQALAFIYKTKGVLGLWHGVSAGVLKTVPKYITAVGVKDLMEDYLPRVDKNDKNGQMQRSAIKSIAAGVSGAALTNPLDVIRNEMFKTDEGLVTTFRSIMKKEGWAFMWRGMASNLTAVSIPIAITVFCTDVLVQLKYRYK